MDRELANKVFHNKQASKQDLRAALAWCLGIEFKIADKTDVETVFKHCLNYFLEAYKKSYGYAYQMNGRDGKALNNVIKKIEATNPGADVYSVFRFIIDNYPQWYKENCFTMPVFDNNFNQLIQQIKKNGKSINDDFKARIINDLQ